MSNPSRNDFKCSEKIQNSNAKPKNYEISTKTFNEWHCFEQLVQSQILEIIQQWTRIDDSIWAKIICFKRNRCQKIIYARSRVISLNGSANLSAFDDHIDSNDFHQYNHQDGKTNEIKRQIRSDFKLKIDDNGNVLIKRVGQSPIFCTPIEYFLNDSIDWKDSFDSGAFACNTTVSLEINKPEVLFDLNSFNRSIISISILDMKSIQAIQNRAIFCIQIAKKKRPSEILKNLSWMLIVNIVALEALWSRLASRTILNKSNVLPSVDSVMGCLRENAIKNRLQYDALGLRKLDFNKIDRDREEKKHKFQHISALFGTKLNQIFVKNSSSNNKSQVNPNKQLPKFTRPTIQWNSRLFYSLGPRI